MHKKQLLRWMTLMLCLLCTRGLAGELGDPVFFDDLSPVLVQAAVPAPDGGLLLAGRASNDEADMAHAIPWAACVDAQGMLRWEAALQEQDTPGIFRDAAALADGRYALIRVADKTQPYASSIVILSPDGREEGHFALEDAAVAIAAYQEGFLVSLYTWDAMEHVDRIPYVAMMDAEGRTLWTKSFDALPYGEIYTLEPAGDGGMLLCGRTKGTPDAPWRGYVAKLSGQEIAWMHRTPQAERDAYVSDCAPLAEGGAVVAAMLESADPALPAQMAAACLDAEGRLLWDTALPSDTDRHVVQIARCAGGFVTASNARGTPDSANPTGEYIQCEWLNEDGTLRARGQTGEMENLGLTVRFLADDAERTFLYGFSRFEGDPAFFLMEVVE